MNGRIISNSTLIKMSITMGGLLSMALYYINDESVRKAVLKSEEAYAVISYVMRVIINNSLVLSFIYCPLLYTVGQDIDGMEAFVHA